LALAAAATGAGGAAAAAGAAGAADGAAGAGAELIKYSICFIACTAGSKPGLRLRHSSIFIFASAYL